VNGLQLATINETDLEPILAIEQNSFQWPWGRISFEGELNSRNACSYVVKSAEGDTCGQVMAYAFLRLAADELQILKIAVRPAWRGQGIATWLLERCFTISAGQGAKSAHLEVRPSNIPAVEFYQKLGFQVIGRQPEYYADSKEDALLMMKVLTRINRENA
jgi:ribosomal-protein-alanine N-acetyltransferase